MAGAFSTVSWKYSTQWMLQDRLGPEFVVMQSPSGGKINLKKTIDEVRQVSPHQKLGLWRSELSSESGKLIQEQT
jgi:hypothetical protein